MNNTALEMPGSPGKNGKHLFPTLFPLFLATQQAQDPPSWILISCFLLFVFAGTAFVYLFRVVDAWVHDHANTKWYVTIFGALWVFLCACIMGMDYFSSFLPKGPLRKLAQKTPSLHASPWVYGIAIGSVVAILVIMGVVDLYQKYASRKRTRPATYRLRRKDGPAS